MRTYYLAPDVHVCKVDGGAVFLDARTNNYMAISGEYVPMLDKSVQGFSELEVAGNPEDTSSPSVAGDPNELVERGLLTTYRSIGHPARSVSVRMQSTLGSFSRCAGNGRLIRAVDAKNFLSSLSWVYPNLRMRRLRRLLDHTRLLAQQTRQRFASPEAVGDPLAAFCRLRTFVYTAKDQCLLNSLVLTHYLHSYQFSPTLVIGVRTRPFSAHAWVQLDDCVLDDKLEELQSFTPILAI